MGIGASATNFLPDDRLQMRRSGNPALAASFRSPAFDLVRLQGYWSVNEWGIAEALTVTVNVEAIDLTNSKSYEFLLEVDDNAGFSSPKKVASEVIATAGASPGQFNLALTRVALAGLDSAAKYMRLGMDPAGVAETGQIAFAAVADNGDTVTISDGVNTTVFTFAASGNGATGAAVNVATGATATDSAQNLEAAILANTNLVGVSASGAAATLTITHNYTGGSITKSDADNDYTVTNFSGGQDPSIKFWAYVNSVCDAV
jgi:hypothetical protein